MKKGHVNTRPIKGTRKNEGETLEEDLLMKKVKLKKFRRRDKSELLMIVDLERNESEPRVQTWKCQK